jgi:hypothetical protein
MAGVMNAQDFNGVSIVLKDAGAGQEMPVVINNSSKALLGWAVKIQTTGVSPVNSHVDFGMLATNTLIKPNEQRPMPGMEYSVSLSRAKRRATVCSRSSSRT